LHSPRRHPDNPIFIGDQPWESWLIEANGRPVVYDPETGKFKLYYVIWIADRKAPFGARYLTCLAISDDGIHWKRPVLGQYEWNGTTENNILKVGDHWMRRPNVIRDRQESDPKRRFKMTFVDVIDGRTAIVKATSADGVHWKRDRCPWFRRAHSSNLLGWDPQIGQYVFFPRISRPRRGVGRSTSKDFVTWTQPKMVMTPDADEQHLRFKGLAAFRYEGVYFGSLWVFEDNQRAEAELAFSRDGIHWSRPFPGQMFFPRGASDAWDSEMVLPVAPIVRDGQIWFFYSGWNIPYHTSALTKARRGWFENHQRKQRAIGLAWLRSDGFVSLNADRKEGELVTKPFRFTGRQLRVNYTTSTAGSLRVALETAEGKPIEGFRVADCPKILGDKIDGEIKWRDGGDISSLVGRPVRLRFKLIDADLYSFRFSTSESTAK